MSQITYYTFTNIHGEIDELIDNIEKIKLDITANNITEFCIIPLGDMIDYGDYSQQSINYLIEENSLKENTYMLLGDHEYMMRGFLKNSEDGPLWLTHGGLETLRSYGIECGDYCEAIEELHIIQQSLDQVVPESHLSFLKNLPAYIETEDFIFSHSGIGDPHKLQDMHMEDFVWEDEKTGSQQQKCLIYSNDNLTELKITAEKIILPAAHTRRQYGDCFVIQKGKAIRRLRNISQ